MIPLDFSIHAEKGLWETAQRTVQKNRLPRAPGNTRRMECPVDKITQPIMMIKHAVQHGFRAKYVLTDSGFSRKGFIQTMRQIKNQDLHVVCGERKDQRQ